MNEETLATYVAEYLAASPDGEVTMLWQGGEPTLRGLPFFRTLVKLCERYRRPGQHVVHAMQTNGTLIDEEWAEFLKANDVLVGVSIDGPEPYHDAYRLNRAGRGTHAMVIRGWNILRQAGVRCNVLCTVHHANEEHGLEVYRYFRDELGADFMQFIPIVERVDPSQLERAEHDGWRATGGQGVGMLYRQAGDAVTSRSTRPAQYGRFLSEIFDEWISRDVGRVFVQDFDAALGALFGQYAVCVHAPECGNNFALEFNGDVYACDHWVEPDWLVGNVLKEDFHSLAHSDRSVPPMPVSAHVQRRLSQGPLRQVRRRTGGAELPLPRLHRVLRAYPPRYCRHGAAAAGEPRARRNHGSAGAPTGARLAVTAFLVWERVRGCKEIADG